MGAPSRSFNLAIEMLVILGFETPSRSFVGFFFCFNLAIEMLVILGRAPDNMIAAIPDCFNLAIEMLVILGRSSVASEKQISLVSISQSRCLSF